MENPLLIEAGQVLCILNGMGMRLFVCEGLGVLTEEHEWDDVVLKAGQEYYLGRQGKTIFISRSPARLRFAVPRDCKARIEVKAYQHLRPIVQNVFEISPRSSGLMVAVTRWLSVCSRALRGKIANVAGVPYSRSSGRPIALR